MRYLPFGEQKVYLQVNRRQMRCEGCPKKFSEDLEFVKKTRTYTAILRTVLGERRERQFSKKSVESELKKQKKRHSLG